MGVDPAVAAAANGGLTTSGPSTHKYIGVPDDYTTTNYKGKGPKGRLGRRQQQAPIYRVGGEYRQVAGKSIEQIAQLQSALIDAGLLDPNDYAPGMWDARSASAMKELLAESNTAGNDWRLTLANRLSLAEQGLIKTKGGRKRAPLSIQLTSPTDVKAGLDNAAPTLLGRKLTNEEMSPFVKAYNDQERMAQTQAYNAAESGGTTVANPSLSGYIDQAVKDKYKTEVGGNQIGQNALVFMKLLGDNAPSAGLPGAQT